MNVDRTSSANIPTWPFKRQIMWTNRFLDDVNHILIKQLYLFHTWLYQPGLGSLVITFSTLAEKPSLWPSKWRIFLLSVSVASTLELFRGKCQNLICYRSSWSTFTHLLRLYYETTSHNTQGQNCSNGKPPTLSFKQETHGPHCSPDQQFVLSFYFVL